MNGHQKLTWKLVSWPKWNPKSYGFSTSILHFSSICVLIISVIDMVYNKHKRFYFIFFNCAHLACPYCSKSNLSNSMYASSDHIVKHERCKKIVTLVVCDYSWQKQSETFFISKIRETVFPVLIYFLCQIQSTMWSSREQLHPIKLGS